MDQETISNKSPVRFDYRGTYVGDDEEPVALRFSYGQSMTEAEEYQIVIYPSDLEVNPNNVRHSYDFNSQMWRNLVGIEIPVFDRLALLPVDLENSNPSYTSYRYANENHLNLLVPQLHLGEIEVFGRDRNGQIKDELIQQAAINIMINLKSISAELFFQTGINTPDTYSPREFLSQKPEGKFIVKTTNIEGGRGIIGLKSGGITSDVIIETGLIGRTGDVSFQIQEYVQGGTPYGCIAVLGNEATTIESIHKQINDDEGRFGGSIWSRDIQDQFSESMIDVLEIIRETGYRGPIGLDFIAKDDEIYLLEVNPRITGVSAIVRLIQEGVGEGNQILIDSSVRFPPKKLEAMGEIIHKEAQNGIVILPMQTIAFNDRFPVSTQFMFIADENLNPNVIQSSLARLKYRIRAN